jgi:hypothetical protein
MSLNLPTKRAPLPVAALPLAAAFLGFLAGFSYSKSSSTKSSSCRRAAVSRIKQRVDGSLSDLFDLEVLYFYVFRLITAVSLLQFRLGFDRRSSRCSSHVSSPRKDTLKFSFYALLVLCKLLLYLLEGVSLACQCQQRRAGEHARIFEPILF